jgi:lipoate-protein ligase A
VSRAELYVDPPATGAWNMAVDQALLEHCEVIGRPIVRLYQWSPATLSLGYFQKHDERLSHAPSLALDLVRRATGGGAIIHDRELTYSLCMPSQERWSHENRQLYDSVHRAILTVLSDYGIQAELYQPEESQGERAAASSTMGDRIAGCGSGAPRSSSPRFLCFERRSPGDVVLKNFKVGGSAQRRGKQALLQHGSILLQKSNFAPERPGIVDLTGKSLNPEAFGEKLLREVALELNLQLEPASLSDALRSQAEKVNATIFSASHWNQNR